MQKVIPDDGMLAEAYRRQHQSSLLKERFAELLEASHKAVEQLDIPAVRGRVQEHLYDNPEER